MLISGLRKCVGLKLVKNLLNINLYTLTIIIELSRSVAAVKSLATLLRTTQNRKRNKYSRVINSFKRLFTPPTWLFDT